MIPLGRSPDGEKRSATAPKLPPRVRFKSARIALSPSRGFTAAGASLTQRGICVLIVSRFSLAIG